MPQLQQKRFLKLKKHTQNVSVSLHKNPEQISLIKQIFSLYKFGTSNFWNTQHTCLCSVIYHVRYVHRDAAVWFIYVECEWNEKMCVSGIYFAPIIILFHMCIIFFCQSIRIHFAFVIVVSVHKSLVIK